MHNGFVPVSRGEKKFDINSNVSLNARSVLEPKIFRFEERKRRGKGERFLFLFFLLPREILSRRRVGRGKYILSLSLFPGASRAYCMISSDAFLPRDPAWGRSEAFRSRERVERNTEGGRKKGRGAIMMGARDGVCVRVCMRAHYITTAP